MVRSFVTRTCRLPSYVPDPAQVRTNPRLDIGSRLEPCLFLQEAGVPYKVWTGVNIREAHGLCLTEGVYHEPYGCHVNDVYVLVNDLEAAGKVLEKAAGYMRTSFIGVNQYSIGYCGDNGRKFIRLVKLSAIGKRCCQWQSSQEASQKNKLSHDVVPGGVLLILAKDWNYPPPSTLLPNHQPIPELPEYFDSHMQLWLEEPLPESRSTARLLTFFHAAEVLDVLLNRAESVGTE
ncbi:uncharacterized protein ASPGLDRAFT_85662 [Aspergillus glaucus CBS 516.65]|uniref:Uncharacterized protein n=1 Tax=Aspergillus glaucus CBS 516.65 TaxID=1160497 RepID=A0A1L9V6P2_ASPGL|nr:hypothetical protein ASPGLDRAFT_85662 [Aspergillus glaucus CBS 516.65]OJJ79590.1 hypothetical protein ASPGLDRAFT_85662 [Aspergillus glaucus CBS 516.65]